MRKKRILALVCTAYLLCACGAADTAAHTASSKESMVEQIAAQKEEPKEDDPVGIAAEMPSTTTPPTAVAEGSEVEKRETTPEGNAAHPTAHDDIDVDLTMLTPTMVYSEVYNIMNDPLSYIGKTIRMNGEFALYLNEIDQMQYYACIITDAAACCANGIEFVRAGTYSFPEDYPEIGEEITVKGVFEIYEENGLKYVHLRDAEMSVP